VKTVEFFIINSHFSTLLSTLLRNNYCCVYLKARIRLRKISIKITERGESNFGLKVSEGCDLDHKVCFAFPLPPLRCNKTLTLSLCVCVEYVAETALFTHCVLEYLAHEVCSVAFSLRTLCCG
jgi:hypothetical protein